MKKNNILLYVLLMLPALLFQSCLKDQEDVFSESASQRMTSTLNKTKEVLRSSAEGWIMDYYPESERKYGGFTYAIKFDELTCDVRLYGDDSEQSTQHYKMTNDNGPTLTFDTYGLMNKFATPSSEEYQAKEGDFEFEIMEVTDDVIRLRGKRTGNTMYLRRLTQSVDSYFAKMAEVEDNLIISRLAATIGATEVTGSLDSDNRQYSLTFNDSTVSNAYVITDQGIRFYEPVTVGGISVSNFAYDATTQNLTALDAGAQGTVLNGDVAADWKAYADFEGSYVLAYDENGSNTVNVSLVPAGDGATYLLKGLNSNFDVVCNYSRSKGTLLIYSQKVGEAGGADVWLCAWSSTEGYLTWSTESGMMLKWDVEADGTVFTFANNGY